MTNRTWNLLLIATHKDHQRKGCGVALIKRIEASLSERQQRILIVETSGLPEFQSQREFYTNRGQILIIPYFPAGH